MQERLIFVIFLGMRLPGMGQCVYQVEHSPVIHFCKTLRLGIVKTVYNYHFVIQMTKDPQRPDPITFRNENSPSQLP